MSAPNLESLCFDGNGIFTQVADANIKWLEVIFGNLSSLVDATIQVDDPFRGPFWGGDFKFSLV